MRLLRCKGASFSKPWSLRSPPEADPFRRSKGERSHDWSVVTLEDWALVRRLAADGILKCCIATKLGRSRLRRLSTGSSSEVYDVNSTTRGGAAR